MFVVRRCTCKAYSISEASRDHYEQQQLQQSIINILYSDETTAAAAVYKQQRVSATPAFSSWISRMLSRSYKIDKPNCDEFADWFFRNSVAFILTARDVLARFELVCVLFCVVLIVIQWVQNEQHRESCDKAVVIESNTFQQLLHDSVLKLPERWHEQFKAEYRRLLRAAAIAAITDVLREDAG